MDKTFSFFIAHIINGFLNKQKNYEDIISPEIKEIKPYKYLTMLSGKEPASTFMIIEFIDGNKYTIEVSPLQEPSKLLADDIIKNGGFHV